MKRLPLDFPGLVDRQFLFSSGLIPRSVTDTIVLHHAAAPSCTIEDVHRWHLERGWAGIGYHYFVSKLGGVFKGRPVEMIGAHAQDHNYHTVGICVEGCFEEEEMSSAQRLAIVALIKHLLTCYPGSSIKRHSDLNATSCPGSLCPFDRIVEEVMGKSPQVADEIDELAKAGLIDSPHEVDDVITWGEFATVINRIRNRKEE